MSRTEDALSQAKDALLYALRQAEKEGAPAAVVRQLEKLTSNAEALQGKLAARRK